MKNHSIFRGTQFLIFLMRLSHKKIRFRQQNETNILFNLYNNIKNEFEDIIKKLKLILL